jgi:hypothetical protein
MRIAIGKERTFCFIRPYDIVSGFHLHSAVCVYVCLIHCKNAWKEYILIWVFNEFGMGLNVIGPCIQITNKIWPWDWEVSVDYHR